MPTNPISAPTPTVTRRTASDSLGRDSEDLRTGESASPEVAKRRLLIVGNGMVSAHFCAELVRLGLHDVFEIVVIGEERVVAYDRVNLSRVLRGDDVGSLTLEPAQWYAAHGIQLCLGAAVSSCDLERRQVRAADEEHAFDVLVFATGSKPLLPKIEGADEGGVCVFRSLEDALTIRKFAERFAHSERPAVIIGAGLLGLEAAAELHAIGLRVELVESGTHLLPRQLDEQTASRVEQKVASAGHTLHRGVRLARLQGHAGKLRAELSDGRTLEACMVVVAAGVRPRDEVAREAGLVCDLFGGIEVDDTLQSSAPGVYAIGECARHRGIAFGLVAPGYQMADVLAGRLAGHQTTFTGATMTTRLKSRDVDVSVVGESTVSDLATMHRDYEDETSYRKLVVRRGKLIGVSVVGSWPEMHLAQQAIAAGSRISERQLRAFTRGRPVWGRASVDLASWPATAPVCSCTGVTCGTLRHARARGATTAELLTKETGAGSVCGSCKPLLVSLCTGERVAATTASGWLTAGSVAAIILASVAMAWSGAPYQESVQTVVPWDVLWRNPIIKQVTGFSIVALTVVGLALSARKRLGWLRRFEHVSLRTFHVLIGVGLLVVLAAHTGFRSGANLDLALNMTFCATALVGGLAAMCVGLERKLSAGVGARLKRYATQVHIWIVWPLPVLTLAHVVKVYFF